MKDNKPKVYGLEDFRKYHEERMTPAEQHRFERELLDNPLTAEAYDGYLLLQSDRADCPAAAASLERQLRERVGGRRAGVLLKYAASAAMLLIAGYFLLTRAPKPMEPLTTKTTPAPEGPVVTHRSDEEAKEHGDHLPARAKPAAEQGAYKPGKVRREIQGKPAGQPKPSGSEIDLLEKDRNIMNGLAWHGQGGETVILVDMDKIASEDTVRRDVKPRPLGGWENFEQYLKASIRETLMYGRTIQFSVINSGKLEEISVEGPDSVKAEVIRVLQEGPRWIPGRDSSVIILPDDMKKKIK